VSRIRGRVRPTSVGALCQLHSGDGVDLCQLAVVHLVHSVSSGRRQGFRESGHSSLSVALLTVGGGSHSLGVSWGGGKVNHQDSLHP
jgi:hypothetical protein